MTTLATAPVAMSMGADEEVGGHSRPNRRRSSRNQEKPAEEAQPEPMEAELAITGDVRTTIFRTLSCCFHRSALFTCIEWAVCTRKTV